MAKRVSKDWIKRIKELAADGHHPQDVRQMLKKEGYPSKSGMPGCGTVYSIMGFSKTSGGVRRKRRTKAEVAHLNGSNNLRDAEDIISAPLAPDLKIRLLKTLLGGNAYEKA